MPVRMSRKLRDALHFANWCRNYKFAPHDAAELVSLASAAFHAGERECNTGRSADPARRRFEDKARTMGLLVTWPGLCPEIARKRSPADPIRLPEV